jgi:hypothetical protein
MLKNKQSVAFPNINHRMLKNKQSVAFPNINHRMLKNKQSAAFPNINHGMLKSRPVQPVARGQHFARDTYFTRGDTPLSKFL